MFKKILLTSVAAGSLMAATSAAQAGGFALREQSAAGMGGAFAGVAAGAGGLSAMFWNPATLTDNPGIQASAVLTGILPYSNITPDASRSATLVAITQTPPPLATSPRTRSCLPVTPPGRSWTSFGSAFP